MKGNQIKEIRCVIWWHWFMSLTSGMSCDPAPVVTMELVTDDEEEALPVVLEHYWANLSMVCKLEELW